MSNIKAEDAEMEGVSQNRIKSIIFISLIQ